MTNLRKDERQHSLSILFKSDLAKSRCCRKGLETIAKRIRNDLEAAAHLDKQAFKQIRSPDGSPMRCRELKMCDTSLEIVHYGSD
jgi:hypothetical protein